MPEVVHGVVVSGVRCENDGEDVAQQDDACADAVSDVPIVEDEGRGNGECIDASAS